MKLAVPQSSFYGHFVQQNPKLSALIITLFMALFAALLYQLVPTLLAIFCIKLQLNGVVLMY